MDPAAFLTYDEQSPEIWRQFEEISLDLIKRGYKHYSAYAILEVIRYHTGLRGGDDFKINNNYRSGYARKFLAKYPQLKGFFEIRTREA